MMKKEYLEPTIEVVEFASEVLMNLTSADTDGAGTGDGEAGDETPDFAGRRRGTWGNLWN